MKMLQHRTPLTEGPPFDEGAVAEHCRADRTEDLTALRNMAWTAAHEIEQFGQIALLLQTVRVTIFQPCREYGLRLPIGPVAEGDTPTVTIDGNAFTAFDFEHGNRPYIRWLADYYDLMPDRMVIEYTAGFGTTAADIPRDLAQAIMDQTALHFDGRSPMDAKSLTNSPHMARVGARYRGVQA